MTVTGLIPALAIHQTALLTHGHGYIHWNSPVALLCGMRVALNHTTAGELTVFLVSLLAGLAGPILVEAMASLRRFTRVDFVGKT